MESTSMEVLAPKKRGRKPLTAEQRAEREAAKKTRNEKATPKPITQSINVSFVSDSAPAKTNASTHSHVMPASEVISLLNSQRKSDDKSPGIQSENQGLFTNTDTGLSNIIPIRPREQPPVTSSQNNGRPKSSVHFKDTKSQIMDDSDDDEELSVSLRPQPKFMDMSTSSVCTIMGAHTTIEKWPESTDLCCWHCCHKFEGVPIPATIKQDKRTSAIQVCGIFCSFNCSKKWILDKNSYSSGEQISLLHLIHKRITGGHYTSIRPAPPRISLKMFGGPLSIEEFRDGMLQLPPTDEMYQNSHRAKVVKELQHNCYPLFSRLMVESKQRGGHTNVKHNPQPTRHERTKPLKTATLQHSMNMNVTIGNSADHGR